MKIYRIAQPVQQQMAPQQKKSQENIQGAMAEISQATALINKSLSTLQTQQMENLFKKDGIINAIQNGDIRKIDQNKVNESLEAMSAISQATLAINQSIKVIEDEGGDINKILTMTVQALQSGNYSAFTETMAGFQQNMTGMTGTIQNVSMPY